MQICPLPKNGTKSKGFTLIELIVVIAVMAVLIAVLAPALLRYVEDSRRQRDESAVGEITHAVHLAMADPETFDAVYGYSIPNNYTTYTDSSATYGAKYEDDQYWAPDGYGRTVTITFNPDENGNYNIADGIVNNMTQGNGSLSDTRELDASKQCTLAEMGDQELYAALKSSIGPMLEEASATYQNSSYTVFIKFENVGTSRRVEVYGEFNGTNLSPTSTVSQSSGVSTPPPETPDAPVNPAPETPSSPNPPSQTPSNPAPDLGGSGGTTGNTGGGGGTQPHTHNYTTVTTPATCTKDGLETNSCTCGSTETKTLAALGHVASTTPAVAPTCETPGQTESSKCSRCSEVLSTATPIAALGHDYVMTQTVATCETPGTKTYTCSRNASHQYTETVSALGHSPVQYGQTAPTCEAPGYLPGTKCSTCDKILQAPILEPATGHTTYTVPGTPATCVNPGATSQETCRVCGKVIKEASPIAPTGHTFAVTSQVAATCTNPGRKVETCIHCGNTKTTTFDALGHIDENNDKVCDRNSCGALLVEVPGLGTLETDTPDLNVTYDAYDDMLKGETPPVEAPKEPELPEEERPVIISFNYGSVETTTKYTPGQYIPVDYEETVIVTKYPIARYKINWSYWEVDEDGNITRALAPVLSGIDNNYGKYIVYNMNTDATHTINDITAQSMILYTALNDSEVTLENMLYIAAYYNKLEGNTDHHIAVWKNGQYVAENHDADIQAITEFTTTQTIVRTKQVEVTAPTSTSEQIYIPLGTLQAEEGMTWAEWLGSHYNTTGRTNPEIVTAAFAAVAYSDVIQANMSYGFVKPREYTLLGEWTFNKVLNIPDQGTMTQMIEFISDNTLRHCGFKYWSDSVGHVLEFMEYVSAEPSWDPKYDDGWYHDYNRTINFGTEPQTVSKEFYEWFTANATQSFYTISGEWVINSSLNLINANTITQPIGYTSNGPSETANYNIFEVQFANPANNDTTSCIYFRDMRTTMSENVHDMAYSSRWNSSGTKTSESWENDGYRFVDFGDVPQYVSKDFYDWMMRNAAPAGCGESVTIPVHGFMGNDAWGETTHGDAITSFSELTWEEIISTGNWLTQNEIISFEAQDGLTKVIYPYMYEPADIPESLLEEVPLTAKFTDYSKYYICAKGTSTLYGLPASLQSPDDVIGIVFDNGMGWNEADMLVYAEPDKTWSELAASYLSTVKLTSPMGNINEYFMMIVDGEVRYDATSIQAPLANGQQVQATDKFSDYIRYYLGYNGSYNTLYGVPAVTKNGEKHLGFMHFAEMTTPADPFVYENGMTWAEFAESEYNVIFGTNTQLVQLDANGNVLYVPNGMRCPSGSYVPVKGTDTINYPANFAYDYTTKQVYKDTRGTVCTALGEHLTAQLVVYNEKQYCPRCAQYVGDAPGQPDTPTITNPIPEGGSYETGRVFDEIRWEWIPGITVPAGQNFPETVQLGDLYTFGEYEYCYGYVWCRNCGKWDTCWFGDQADGWSVRYIGNSAQPSAFLAEINGVPVTNLEYTFAYNNTITHAPVIHANIMNMHCAFENSKNLQVAPVMTNASNVTDMSGAFYGCTGLTGTITINQTPANYTNCFTDVDFQAQRLMLAGGSNVLDNIGLTGDNYCIDCNGYCFGHGTGEKHIGYVHFFDMSTPADAFLFEDGMTWAEFINSSYNVIYGTSTKLFKLDANGYVQYIPAGTRCPPGTFTPFKGTDRLSYPANYVYSYDTKYVGDYSMLSSVCDSSAHLDRGTTYNNRFYCMRCARYTDIPMQPISGTWKFINSPARLTDTEEIAQDVNFISNGVAYDKLLVKNTLAEGTVPILELKYYKDSASTSVYATGYMNWAANAYQTVDFGSTTQLVTKEFYDWFTANAQEVQYTLSGAWEFNNTRDGYFGQSMSLAQNINFTSAGKSYNKMSLSSVYEVMDSGYIYYNSGSTQTTVYWEDYGPGPSVDQRGWNNTSYRTVDFGSTPQTVSKTFYDWFTTNARPSEAKISGKWAFNVQLNIDSSWSELVNFTTAGGSYTAMAVVDGTNDELQYINNTTKTVWTTADLPIDPLPSYWYKNTNQQIVDFGATEQGVSKQFYNWIVANATPYVENTETATISGKWVFNDTLTHTGWASGSIIKHESVNVIGTKESGEPTETRTSFDYYPAYTMHNTFADFSTYYCETILLNNSRLYPLYHFSDECTSSACLAPNTISTIYKTVDFGATAQTVSKEFYDWFMANTTPYREVELVPISGTWIINREPNRLTEIEQISQDVNFTSNGTRYTTLNIENHLAEGVAEILCLYYKTSSNSTNVYATGYMDWANAAYKTVEFGSTEQMVSKDFYDWFVDNATQQTTIAPTHTLEGTWKWNNTISQTDWASGTQQKLESIDFKLFSADGQEEYAEAWPFESIAYYPTGTHPGAGHEECDVILLGDYWQFPLYSFHEDCLECEAMCYQWLIDFGASPQAVTEEFYNWFIANATPYDNTTPESQLKQLSGKWQWNSTIDFTPATTPTTIYDESVTFVSGGNKFKGLRLYSPEGIMTALEYYLYDAPYGDTLGAMEYYRGENIQTWNESMRLVDFGKEAQFVSESFYNWFVNNATQYADSNLIAISGEWTFNEVVRPINHDGIYEYVNYSSGGHSFSEMQYVPPEYNEDGSMSFALGWGYLDYYPADNTTGAEFNYFTNPFSGGYTCYWLDNGAENTNMRVVDFGETEQLVTKAFYDWLVANTQSTDTTSNQLSGVWEWNDSLQITESIPYEKVQFTYNNTTYKGMTADYQSTTLPSGTVNYTATLFFGTQDSFTLATSFNVAEVTKQAGTQWNNKSAIDFGITPQTVSQAFYDWFIANATPNTTSYVLYGTYKMNATPTIPSGALSLHEEIDGYIEGGQFDSITVEHIEGLDYAVSFGSVTPGEPLEGVIGWFQEYYNTFTFEEPQVVSKEFYEWFTTNAIPYEISIINFTVDGTTYEAEEGMTWREWIQSEYCPGGFNLLTNGSGVSAKLLYLICHPDSCRVWPDEKIQTIDYVHIDIRYTTSQTISGAWKFNNTVTLSNAEYVYQEINYTSNGQSYTKMILTNDTAMSMLDVDYANTTETINAFTPSTASWCGDNYRIVDFGASAQNVSKVFYNWIIANAVPYVETPESEEFTFTIEDVEYHAEEGMTWNEWCASEYNTNGYIALGGARLIKYDESTKTLITIYYMDIQGTTINMVDVEADETIIENYAYKHLSASGPPIVLRASDREFMRPATAGCTTFDDIANGLKNGTLLAAIMDTGIFTNYDDCYATLTLYIQQNGTIVQTLSQKFNIMGGGASISLNGLPANAEWYLANSNKKPTGSVLATGAQYVYTGKEDAAFVISYSTQTTPKYSFSLPVKELYTGNIYIDGYVTLHDNTGAQISSYRTDGSGNVNLTSIEPGTYSLRTQGFSIEFTLTADGNLTYKHVGVRENVALTLNDGVAHTFTLMNTNMQVLSTRTTTASNGSFAFNMIPSGTYYLLIDSRNTMQTLIIANDGSYSLGADLVVFQIEETKYVATTDMQWSQWVSSSYNRDGYILSNSVVCNTAGDAVTYGGPCMKGTDTIVAGRQYLVGKSVIETAHDYANSQNYVVLGTWDYPNAQSVDITIEYQTESTSYDWISLTRGNDYVAGSSYSATRSYLDTSGNIVSATGSTSSVKFGGTTRTTKTFTNVNMTQGTVVFRTDGSVVKWGAKVTIVPKNTPAAKELITFKVYDAQYQAEEGMTWGEWISSSYNTSNLTLAPDNYAWFEASTYLFTDAKCTQKCHKDDVIATRAYYGNYSGYMDMLTFEIDGTAYQAEQGMTWSQWISSKYNVDGYVISGTTVYNSDKSKKIASVTSSSAISANSNFSLTSVSTGTTTHGGGSN